MTISFKTEHLVCELPTLRPHRPFQWYEVDADAEATAPGTEEAPFGANLIASTRSSAGDGIMSALEIASARRASHLQFEAPTSAKKAGSLIRLIADHGLTAIPARHLNFTPSHAVLLRHLEKLAEQATDYVKLAYPAVDARSVESALIILADWPVEAPKLSLTPMGGRQARLAAALAGSRLVFAPAASSSERMSAFWLRELFDSAEREEEPWLRTI